MKKFPYFIVAISLLAACGSRTSPATQPAPADWDPSKNDPKAVEVTTAMLTALGGAENWDAVKQISWDLQYKVNDQVQGIFHHDWDRWNARHRFEQTSMKSYQAAQASGDKGDLKLSVSMYPLFERNRGTARWGGQEMPASDQKQAIAMAYERWRQDAYLLSFAYKVNDPGVILSYEGETKDTNCPQGCKVIKVTFHGDVGKDTYYINVADDTNLPHMVELEMDGKPGRIAYSVVEWVDVNGLKFPGKFDNLGVRNSGGGTEVWELTNLKIASPDDMLYIPQVR